MQIVTAYLSVWRSFATLPVLLLLLVATPVTAAEPRVAAASSLRGVMPELMRTYTAQTGHQPQISFGSSGLFARQIGRGAPFDLFLSADTGNVERLVDQGVTQGAGVDYARGRLALYVRHDSPLGDPASLELADLPVRIAAGRSSRFAIPHPEHAPYGAAARQALMRAGAWEGIKGALVIGENASQAVRFLQSGAAGAGLLPIPLIRSGPLAELGLYRPLTSAEQPMLAHRMVLISGAAESSRVLFDFLLSDPAQTILERHGFGRAVER